MIYSGKMDYKQDVFGILATHARLTNGMSILGKVHFEIFIKFPKIQKIFIKNIDTKQTQRSEPVFQFSIFQANVFFDER